MHPVDARFLDALRSEFGAKFHDRRAEIDALIASLPGKRRLLRPGGPTNIDGHCVHHIGPGVDYGGWDIVDAWTYALKSAPWVDANGGVRRGWDTGNYMAGILPNGDIELAALPSQTTYHAGGRFNDRFTSIVFLHDCRSGQRVGGPPLDNELATLYRWLRTCDVAIANKPWRGHLELKPTACPSPNVMYHLRRMRGPAYGAAATPPDHYVPSVSGDVAA